jgi:hypothetical protein
MSSRKAVAWRPSTATDPHPPTADGRLTGLPVLLSGG